MNLVTVYFSKDRPLQLDLAIRSNQHHCLDKENLNEVVLYKASNVRFEKAYELLQSYHPTVTFIKEESFKHDLFNCLKRKEYVLFIVDDCVFTHDYSITQACEALEALKTSIGFSLRLGKNTKYCYSLDCKNDIPALHTLIGDISNFEWGGEGKGDFYYPLEVSSSIYRVVDIAMLIMEGNYNTPNSLEYMMSLNTTWLSRLPFLLCYETSVAFCNPINKIQIENNNRAGYNPLYDINSLLTKFEKCGIIDYKKFDNFVSNGCHQEVDIEITYDRER